MENAKVLAYLYSNELTGTEMKQQEVEILDSKTENGKTNYLVKTQKGVVCTAIFNPFTSCYYADDIFGIIDNYQSQSEM